MTRRKELGGRCRERGSGSRITRPLRLYVLLEATIAVLGVSLVWLLPALTPALALVLRPLQEQPWLLNAVRLSIVFM